MGLINSNPRWHVILVSLTVALFLSLSAIENFLRFKALLSSTNSWQVYGGLASLLLACHGIQQLLADNSRNSNTHTTAIN